MRPGTLLGPRTPAWCRRARWQLVRRLASVLHVLQLVGQVLLHSQYLGNFFLHLDHLLGPLQFHLQACDLVPQALQLWIHRQLRLRSSFLRGQGVLLPAGGLPAPGVDVRAVQSLAPQESPSLPLRGRFVLPEHLELVLGLESSSLGLGQYLGVSLRCPVLLCQHASRTFSPSPVIRKVFGVSRTLAQRVAAANASSFLCTASSFFALAPRVC